MIHPQKSQKFGFLPQIGEFFFLKSKIKSKKSFLKSNNLCTKILVVGTIFLKSRFYCMKKSINSWAGNKFNWINQIAIKNCLPTKNISYYPISEKLEYWKDLASKSLFPPTFLVSLLRHFSKNLNFSHTAQMSSQKTFFGVVCPWKFHNIAHPFT